jgi:hypothetical protein
MRLIDADALVKELKDDAETMQGLAFQMACSHLIGVVESQAVAITELPQWIPCAERVPEDTDYVLCTTETKKCARQVVRGYFMPDLKQWVSGMNSNVVAWMPLPIPWEGGTG